MGSSSLRPLGRGRLLAFAIVGSVLPVIIAAATNRSAHPVFYVGAAFGCLAPLAVALVPRRQGLVVWAAAFAEIPALTAMQAYSGGVGSGSWVLVWMAMVLLRRGCHGRGV